MKKATKILALILTVVLAIGVLCGCGGSKSTREKGKYSYWVNVDSRAGQTIEKYDDMLMYQELQKRTGIDIDFIHPTKGSVGSEAFQILLTSSDMPDMVEYDWTSYPGGADKAIEDKVIIRINEYMEEAAPNYYSYMEGEKAKENNYAYKVDSLTNKGNYYGFRQLNIGSYRGFGGLYIRKDLLNSWGLDIPVTIDDWTNVFKTAKENGIKKPLTGTNMFAITAADNFNGAWHVGKTYHVEDGKVIFSLECPEYKDYLKQLSDWYKAGYIDPDFLTNDSEVVQGNMTRSVSIATFGFVGSGIGKLLPAMADKDPNFDLAACPYPILKEGDVPWFQELYSESMEPTIAITVACGKDDEERYKEAMSYCDYLYSDEGIVLKSFGVEGKTFYTEKNPDGSTKYKYIISDPKEQEKVGAHSVEAVLYHYFRPAGCPGFNQHDDYLDGFYPYAQQKEAINVWNTYIDEARKHKLPTLNYTEEEASLSAELTTKCRDKLDATVTDIIRNEVSIDKFDEAVKEAKKNGFDELVKIRQAAYDRYLAKIK